MFVDYYAVLGIQYPSSLDEIKKAYRALSLKWHPDRNHGVDTSQKMIEINEAYYILKDIDKKNRYDIEYNMYKVFENNTPYNRTNQSSSSQEQEKTDSNPCPFTSSQYYSSNYHFHNIKVEDDIKEAHIFAKNLVDEFLREFKESSKRAAKGAWEEMQPYVILIFILPILFALIRSCQ